MTIHYVVADLHHGSNRVVRYLKDQAKAGNGKIHVSSTGDFSVYKANASGPEETNHPFVEAFQKGDKDAMAKHEPEWTKKVVEQTSRAGKTLQELKPILEGGKINAIMGNSDYAVSTALQKHRGTTIQDVLGGGESAIRHITGVETRKQDNTTFVYVAHDPNIISKYQGKSYKEIKADLLKDESYKKLADQIKTNGTKYVAILMHESPKPEKWYQGEKVKQRLPEALRAHYDTLVEAVSKYSGASKVNVIHGHLHEQSEQYKYMTNTSQMSNVNVQMLNIDDIVKYDTVNGGYSIEKAPQVSHFMEGEKGIEKKVKDAKMKPRNRPAEGEQTQPNEREMQYRKQAEYKKEQDQYQRAA